MNFIANPQRPHEFDGCALVVDALDDNGRLAGTVAELDSVSNGFFSHLLESEDLPVQVGKVGLYHRVPGVAAQSVLVSGAGKPDKYDASAAFRCAGAATKRLGDRQRERVGLYVGTQQPDLVAHSVVGAMNGGIGQDLFRDEPNLYPADQIEWLQADVGGLERGQILGEAVLLARELVNLPANILYPETFAQHAARVAMSSGLELEVWDELRLRKEGCDTLLAVSAGSSKAPRLLILRYSGQSQKQAQPLALVGKGVTFDSGGLSLKPSDGMMAMKCDMGGAATVLAAMQAIANLKVDSPVVGLVGLVENMVSGSSFKLGDVIQSRSGKSIEIHNTDAEGRLVLADVLNVALDEDPAQIVDVATLTGACLVALGMDIAGLMCNDEPWQRQLQKAAELAGEDLWPLPMHDHFGEQIKSKVADIKNMGTARWGGAITAAKFLQEFVGDVPWAHLDIAGPAFLDSPKPHLDAGGSGAFVKTLVQLAENLS